jgi:hypothetical protein
MRSGETRIFEAASGARESKLGGLDDRRQLNCTNRRQVEVYRSRRELIDRNLLSQQQRQCQPNRR